MGKTGPVTRLIMNLIGGNEGIERTKVCQQVGVVDFEPDVSIAPMVPKQKNKIQSVRTGCSIKPLN